MYGRTERLEWNEQQFFNVDNNGVDYLRGIAEIQEEYSEVREILGEDL